MIAVASGIQSSKGCRSKKTRLRQSSSHSLESQSNGQGLATGTGTATPTGTGRHMCGNFAIVLDTPLTKGGKRSKSKAPFKKGTKNRFGGIRGAPTSDAKNKGGSSSVQSGRSIAFGRFGWAIQ